MKATDAFNKKIPQYNPVMVEASAQERDMLMLALTKARKLVGNIEKQQAEIEASPPKISPEKLGEGRTAFANAIASAKRSVKALEEAIAMIESSPNSN